MEDQNLFPNLLEVCDSIKRNDKFILTFKSLGSLNEYFDAHQPNEPFEVC